MKANWIRLYFEEQGKGLPLILIHGFPLNHTIWKPMLPFIRPDVRVVSPDLRGYGKSPVTQGIYAMRLLAEDIVRLMDELRIDKGFFVGHSMGGYITLALAQAFPDRMLGLGLVSSQARADTPEKRSGRFAMAEEVGRLGTKPAADALAVKLTSDENLQGKLYDLIMSNPAAAIIGALKGMAEREDMLPLLPKINGPAVVIHGDHDLTIPLELGQEAAEGLSNGVFTKIKGAGHMPMMEAPEVCAQALNQGLSATITRKTG